MKRQKILVICFAVLFCLLIAAYIFVVRPMTADEGEAETEAPETEAGEAVGIMDRIFMFEYIEAEDVARYDVENEYGGYSFVRDKEGNFILEGYDTVPYDSEKFATLVSLTTYTLSKTKVMANAPAEKLAEYGLDAPVASWTVTTKSGETHTVYVGGRLLTGGGYYCMYEGRNSVYVLDTDIDDVILCPTETLVTPVLVAGIDQSDYYTVDNFTVFKGREMLFSLKQVAKEDMNNKEALAEVIMDYPTEYYPDSSFYYELIYDYMSLVGESCYKLGITEEDIVELGLDEPAHAITYEYGGTQFAMYFSEKTEDGKYYAMSNIYPEYISVFSADSLEYLEYELIDWIDPYLFQQYITNVAEMEVEVDGKTTVFELEHSLSDDGSATVLDVKINGRDLAEDQIANFRQYYKSFLAITMDGYILDDEYSPFESEADMEAYLADEDKVYLTFRFTTIDGDETEMKFYQYSTRHSAATVNGVGEFYVVTDLIQKIANDTDRIINGETVTAFAKN